MTTSDLPPGEDFQLELAPLFPLGRLVATPGALHLLALSRVRFETLLQRHRRGDWGDVSVSDAQENTRSIEQGLRILSVYRCGAAQDHVWVITEADRSVTTLLLPTEY